MRRLFLVLMLLIFLIGIGLCTITQVNFIGNFTTNAENLVLLERNEFNDSSTSKTLTYTGVGNNTIGIFIPKERNVTKAEVNVTGGSDTTNRYWVSTDGYTVSSGTWWNVSDSLDADISDYGFVNDSNGHHQVDFNVTMGGALEGFYSTGHRIAKGTFGTVTYRIYAYNITSTSWVETHSTGSISCGTWPFFSQPFTSDTLYDVSNFRYSDNNVTFRIKISTVNCWNPFPDYYQRWLTFYVKEYTGFPDNPLLEVDLWDGTNEWSYSGNFSSTETADLNSSLINNFLDACTADSDGLCNLNLTFQADSVGILTINSVNVTYSYNVTNLIKWDWGSMWNGSAGLVGKKIYWNWSHPIVENITVNGWYTTNDSVTKVFYDGDEETVYGTSNKWINTTDISITTVTNLNTTANHTYWDNFMDFAEVNITPVDYATSFVQGGTRTKDYTFYGRGTINLSYCNFSGAGLISGKVSFNNSNFNISSGSKGIIRATYSSASPGLFSGNISVSCSYNSTVNDTSSVTLSVSETTGSTSPGGGGTDDDYEREKVIEVITLPTEWAILDVKTFRVLFSFKSFIGKRQEFSPKVRIMNIGDTTDIPEINFFPEKNILFSVETQQQNPNEAVTYTTPLHLDYASSWPIYLLEGRFSVDGAQEKYTWIVFDAGWLIKLPIKLSTRPSSWVARLFYDVFPDGKLGIRAWWFLPLVVGVIILAFFRGYFIKVVNYIKSKVKR